MSAKGVQVPYRSFRGVWRGQFNDKNFVTINELENAEKQLTYINNSTNVN